MSLGRVGQVGRVVARTVRVAGRASVATGCCCYYRSCGFGRVVASTVLVLSAVCLGRVATSVAVIIIQVDCWVP